uniref:Haloacid dehalogenase-like hydrolase domain-containing protein 3 n=1 Tax=Anopheles atroparvus TaxID=41427 RepID=A0AAG5DW25_ANOAO
MNYFRTNLSRFKLITFDVTDTLLEYAVRPERHYAHVINSVLEPHLKVAIDEKIIGKSFVRCFRSMKSQYPNFGYTRKFSNETNREENWHWWWRTLVERVILEAASQSNCNKIPQPLLGKIANQLIDDYTFDTKQVCWKKCAGVDLFLRALQETRTVDPSTQYQGKIVGVISNFDSRLSTILLNNGISSTMRDNCETRMVDFIITSYEAGVEKPDPKIFEIALKRANLQSHTSPVQPHEALHIGNLYNEDFLGARGAGWHALLVNVPKANEEAWKIPRRHIFSGISDLQVRLENDPIFEW